MAGHWALIGGLAASGGVVGFCFWLLARLFPQSAGLQSAPPRAVPQKPVEIQGEPLQRREGRDDVLETGEEDLKKLLRPYSYRPKMTRLAAADMMTYLVQGNKIMDIAANASVYCLDGYYGQVAYIILNPITKQVTHLVVEEDVLTFPQRLVPINMVANSSPSRIQLICKKSELRLMEHFIRTEFLPSNVSDYSSAMHLMWPYSISQIEMKAVELESIPSGELAVRRNAGVYARDGLVGYVDEYIVSAQGDRITHLGIRTGRRWEHKRLNIPISQIERIEKNVVYLNLSKRELEQLLPAPTR